MRRTSLWAQDAAVARITGSNFVMNSSEMALMLANNGAGAPTHYHPPAAVGVGTASAESARGQGSSGGEVWVQPGGVMRRPTTRASVAYHGASARGGVQHKPAHASADDTYGVIDQVAGEDYHAQRRGTLSGGQVVYRHEEGGHPFPGSEPTYAYGNGSFGGSVHYANEAHSPTEHTCVAGQLPWIFGPRAPSGARPFCLQPFIWPQGLLIAHVYEARKLKYMQC